MTRLIAVLCLVALAGPGAAMAEIREVKTSLNTFQPRTLNVLTGDQVSWMNQSFSVQHNLGEPFNTELAPRDTWLNPTPFDTKGVIHYLCTIHPTMAGTIAVHDVYLRGPGAAVLFGNAMSFSGLAPTGEQVEIQRDENDVWTTVDTFVAGPADAFSGGVKPAKPGRYRAEAPAGVSPVVNVAVKPRVTLAKKRLPRKRTRVTVTAAPISAGAVAVLQRKKPAGWSKITSKRLGTNSKAAFVVRPPKGTWRVRALVKASGDYAAGQSAVIAVKR